MKRSLWEPLAEITPPDARGVLKLVRTMHGVPTDIAWAPEYTPLTGPGSPGWIASEIAREKKYADIFEGRDNRGMHADQQDMPNQFFLELVGSTIGGIGMATGAPFAAIAGGGALGYGATVLGGYEGGFAAARLMRYVYDFMGVMPAVGESIAGEVIWAAPAGLM